MPTTPGDGPASERTIVCRADPDLVEHVRDLLADAGLESSPGVPDPDGLVPVLIDAADDERARSVIGLVLPQLLEPPTQSFHLSDRLIRTEDPSIGRELPGGLVDGRYLGGYADPLAEEDDLDGADEDFTPPAPPPIPRPRDRFAVAAWAGVIGGPVLLIAAHLLGFSSFWTALALAMFIAGFAVLVARMDDGPKQDDGWDDGAVL